MKISIALTLLLTLSASAQTPAPQPINNPLRPKAVPADFNDHTGFSQLFDGKTLNGWTTTLLSGPSPTASSSSIPLRRRKAHAQLIILLNHEPADFELRLEIKMEGPTADSGIQYRHPEQAACHLQARSLRTRRSISRPYLRKFLPPASNVDCCGQVSSRVL